MCTSNGEQCTDWDYYGDNNCSFAPMIGQPINGCMGSPDGCYCSDNGYTMSPTLYDPTGGEYALCIFTNETACDSWAYYRGECNVTNPNFQVYCTDNGGELSQKSVDWGDVQGSPPAEYEVCTTDGVECTENDYYTGQCSTQVETTTSDSAVADVTSKKDYNVPFGSAAQVTCTSGSCCVVGGNNVWGSVSSSGGMNVFGGDDCKVTSTEGTFSDCGNTEGCDLNCSNDCTVQITPTTSDPTQADDAPATIGMPNPASTGCADKGGTEETLYQADGGQYGVCVFNDGTACESWALERGECTEGTTLVFSTYCADNGGQIVEENVDWGDVQGAPPATYEVCTVNGAHCAANNYYTTGCADLTVPGTTPGTDSTNGTATEAIGEAVSATKVPKGQSAQIDCQSGGYCCVENFSTMNPNGPLIMGRPDGDEAIDDLNGTCPDISVPDSIKVTSGVFSDCVSDECVVTCTGSCDVTVEGVGVVETPAPPVPTPPAGPTPAQAPEEVLDPTPAFPRLPSGAPGEPSGSNGLSYGVMVSLVVISIFGVLV